jgi:putative transposase
LRNERLTIEWFRNRLEAQVAIEQWRRHYNEERPHMSLGDLTPAAHKVKIKGGWLTKGPEAVVLQ